jgi:3-isopropylmalate/(R)-2-methylmalate dehydratase small subunit
MDKFTRVSGIAAPLIRNNVDTDAIIPSRETRSVSRDGYGEKLFANWRYEPGSRLENPGFVLNQAPFRQARILASGSNFGCGSSREAAAWALYQFGIRCVIAESFGAIFQNNCVRNGILPVALPADAIAQLLAADESGRPAEMEVDLLKCEVRAQSGQSWTFSIGALDREMLLEGLDEISLTKKMADDISRFEQKDKVLRPWIYELSRRDQTGSSRVGGA